MAAAPDEGTTWLLLSAVYHRVRARMPTDRAAQIAIADARRDVRLRMRAELRVHEARPDLCLALGEKPPAIQPNIIPDYLILSTDVFQKWDWEYSRATRWDEKTRTLFEYVNIVVHRDNALACWPGLALTGEPAATTTVDPPRSEVQAGLSNSSPMLEKPTRPEGVTPVIERPGIPRPKDVSYKLWVVMQTLDVMEDDGDDLKTVYPDKEALRVAVHRRLPKNITLSPRQLRLAQEKRRKYKSSRRETKHE